MNKGDFSNTNFENAVLTKADAVLVFAAAAYHSN